MSLFNNLRISKKLIIGFGSVMFLTVALGIFSITQIAKVNDSAVEIGTNWMVGVRTLGQLHVDIGAFRRFELNHIMASSDADVKNFEARMDETLQQFKKDEAAYAATVDTEAERQLYTKWKQEWEKYLSVHERVLALS